MTTSAASSALHDVGGIDDLTEGRPAIVRVAGRELVIVRHSGSVYAVRNVCPHQTQSFAGGQVHARLEGGDRLGELEVFDDDPVLACPWHGFEFRLRGGQCLVNPKLRVRAYPVEIRDGRVYVDIGAARTRTRTRARAGAGDAD